MILGSIAANPITIDPMVLQTGWQEVGERVSQLIARAWLNPEFKERLIAHTRETLQQEGIEIPEGVEVIIDQTAYDWSIGSRDGHAVWTIPLPPKPVTIGEEVLSAWTEGNLSKELVAIMPNCC